MERWALSSFVEGTQFETTIKNAMGVAQADLIQEILSQEFHDLMMEGDGYVGD